MNSFCNLCTLVGGQSAEKKEFHEESERKAHAQLHFHQSKLIDRNATIEQIVGQCFDGITARNGNQNGGVKSTRQSALVNFVREMMADRSKSLPGSCQQCGKRMMLFNHLQKYWRADKVVHHATSHLEDPLFICCHCDYKSYTKYSIKQHIRKIHGAESYDYDDLSSAYEEEIKESIKSCFQGGASKLHTTNAKILMHKRHRIRSHISGSELKVQRHIRGGSIVKTGARENGNIVCRLCSTAITRLKPSFAVGHAEGHLKKPLYQCKRCLESFFTYVSMVRHARKRHKISVTNSYSDRSDQFHAEIMEVLDKCFAKP